MFLSIVFKNILNLILTRRKQVSGITWQMGRGGNLNFSFTAICTEQGTLNVNDVFVRVIKKNGAFRVNFSSKCKKCHVKFE